MLRRFNDFTRINSNRPANGDKLCDVKPPLAELEFRHERLTLPETLPKLHLRDAGVLASLHKQFNHSLIEIGAK